MATGADGARATWFQRYLLPGFALKAVIIGGGYATGRELAEFFLPSGPWGGLAAMLLATVLWSVIAALTFALARVVGAYDYRSFFQSLLGPGWIVFEIAYVLFVVLILAVFGAAAGAIGAAMFGWPPILGTAALAVGIAGFAAFGNASVEGLFKYVSFLLYGERIPEHFVYPQSSDGWALGGITYAGYNIIGAVVILPMLRHLTSQRDAIISGLIAGPLAMAPAVLFFVCMVAFWPGIETETLPSNFMLERLEMPLFQLLFQLMIFSALLESGTGSVHAINERIAGVWRARRSAELGRRARGGIAAALLIVCMFVADRFGLVALIASGYRALAVVFILIYVIPLLTIGVVRLLRARPRAEAPV